MINQAGDILLDGRYRHSHRREFDPVCGRLLGPMPATQWYKVRPCHIKAHEISICYAGCIRYQASHILLDGRLLHDRLTDIDSLGGRLLGLTPASQRYRLREVVGLDASYAAV